MSAPVRNIVLDTSFIEGQNFLEGTVMNDLKYISRKHWAWLYMTDIVYREVLSRFRQRVTTEIEKTKNLHNQIENSLKVIKNIAIHKPYFELPHIDIKSACETFKIRFDKYIKEAKFKIIPSGHLSIAKVFDDYFNSLPPFGTGDKKAEFPDAFSYLAIKEHFEKAKDIAYLVTYDKDFDELPRKAIIPVKHAREPIDAIIRFEEEKKSKTPEFIALMFDREKSKLQLQSHKLITEFIEEEVQSKGELNGREIDVLDKIDLSNIDITGFSIVFLGDGEARIECPANFAYELDIVVEDKDDAWYDKEDDKWHFVESLSVLVKGSHDVVLTILIKFDEDLTDAEFEIDAINDGKGFEIFSRWDDHHY